MPQAEHRCVCCELDCSSPNIGVLCNCRYWVLRVQIKNLFLTFAHIAYGRIFVFRSIPTTSKIVFSAGLVQWDLFNILIYFPLLIRAINNLMPGPQILIKGMNAFCIIVLVLPALGSDGCYHFWDKETKRRLKAMERINESITCGTFNRDGSLYAYAVSYDWSKGCQQYNPASTRNTVMLHPVTEADVSAKASTGGTARRR